MNAVDFGLFVPLDDGKHVSEGLHEAGQFSLLRSCHHHLGTISSW